MKTVGALFLPFCAACGILLVDSVHATVPVKYESARLQVDGDSEDLYRKFGYSTAFSGNTLVVGDPQADDAGAAFVYQKENDSEWTLKATLVAPFAEGYHEFGESVAVEGNTVAVGDHRFGGNPSYFGGVVYLFVLSHQDAELEWELTQTLFPPDTPGTNDAGYGEYIVLSENYLAVAAPFSYIETPRLKSGMVFVYSRTSPDTVDVESMQVLNSDIGFGEYNGLFGRGLAIQQDSIFVGAPGSASNVGSLYLFQRSANGTFVKQQKVRPPRFTRDTVRLGTSVSSNQNYVVAAEGCYRACNSTLVTIYSHDTGELVLQDEVEIMIPPGAVYIDRVDVALADTNRIVCGVVSLSANYTLIGSVHVYELDEATNTWMETAELKRTTPLGNEFFGHQVAISEDGNTLAASSMRVRLPRKGSVSLFELPTTMLPPEELAIDKFILFDTFADPALSSSEKRVAFLNDGDTFSLSEIGTGLTVRVQTDGPVDSVVFGLNDNPMYHIEERRPFVLGGDYPPWNLTAVPELSQPGTYVVSATAYEDRNGQGTRGETKSVTFHLVE